jgi:hypothetical protein
MKDAIVTLRSPVPDFFNSARKVSAHFVSAKDYKGQAIDKVEEGFFYCDLPTKVEYEDDFGEKKILYENYAQTLLDCYPRLEVVEAKEVEIVSSPIVTKKKGKKNEKVIS